MCQENPKLLLGDDAYKVILNASGKQKDVSENLMDFFHMLLSGEGKTNLSRKITEEVERARKHDEWRLEFMTLFMRDEEKRAEGLAEGLVKGEEIGTKKTLEKSVKAIYSMTQNSTLTIEQAAAAMEMTEEEFLKLAKMD